MASAVANDSSSGQFQLPQIVRIDNDFHQVTPISAWPHWLTASHKADTQHDAVQSKAGRPKRFQ